MDMLSEAEKSSLLFEIQSINARAITLLTTFSRVKLDVIQKAQLSQKQPHHKAHVAKIISHLKTFVYWSLQKKWILNYFEN